MSSQLEIAETLAQRNATWLRGSWKAREQERVWIQNVLRFIADCGNHGEDVAALRVAVAKAREALADMERGGGHIPRSGEPSETCMATELEQLRWRVEVAEAEVAVIRGTWCNGNMSEGRGPCGVCPTCAKENHERAENAELERDALIGLGPERRERGLGGNRCSDCGRLMVWERAYDPKDPTALPGAWMCPTCVMQRCRSAEACVADAGLRIKLDGIGDREKDACELVEKRAEVARLVKERDFYLDVLAAVKRQDEIAARGDALAVVLMQNGTRLGDIAAEIEILKRDRGELRKLLTNIRNRAQEALDPDEDATAIVISRGRGHTVEEDWRDALQVIRDWIDAEATLVEAAAILAKVGKE